jgi:oligopeptidase A
LLETLLSSHETSEHIPEALFSSFRRAHYFRVVTTQMRQLGFVAIDLELHTSEVLNKMDVLSFARQFMAPFWPARLPGYFAMIACFGQLFEDADGYAASYNSYKWTEVLEADAFTILKTKVYSQ